MYLGLQYLFHPTDGTILFLVNYKLFCPYLIMLSRTNAKRSPLPILQGCVRITSEEINHGGCFIHDIVKGSLVTTWKSIKLKVNL